MSILGSIVQSSGGGGASSALQADIDRLEENIGLNSLRDAVNGGWSWFSMIDGVADVFTDETGVNTGGATDATYNATGDFYAPSIGVNLLLHCDGTDGSTTFPDDTGIHTATANGDAQIDTDQSKFGGASALFDGTGDYLSIPDSADWDFGSGDFTIDCWVRRAATGVQLFAGQWQTNGTDGCVYLGTNSSSQVQLILRSSSVNYTAASTATLSTAQWYHVAGVRDGNTLRIFIDGVADGTADVTGLTADNSSLGFFVGSANGANSFNGHLDELRVIKGAAAWTTGFTPPTSAYSITSASMVLPSDEFATLATPTSGRLVVLYDPIDAVTLNTDLIFECSRDGGTTWTSWALEANALFAGTVEILTTEDLDISAQPTGSLSIIWRATTANEKDVQIHGVYLQWR